MEKKQSKFVPKKYLVYPGNKMARKHGGEPITCKNLHTAIKVQKHYGRQGFKTTISL